MSAALALSVIVALSVSLVAYLNLTMPRPKTGMSLALGWLMLAAGAAGHALHVRHYPLPMGMTVLIVMLLVLAKKDWVSDLFLASVFAVLLLVPVAYLIIVGPWLFLVSAIAAPFAGIAIARLVGKRSAGASRSEA